MKTDNAFDQSINLAGRMPESPNLARTWSIVRASTRSRSVSIGGNALRSKSVSWSAAESTVNDDRLTPSNRAGTRRAGGASREAIGPLENHAIGHHGKIECAARLTRFEVAIANANRDRARGERIRAQIRRGTRDEREQLSP